MARIIFLKKTQFHVTPACTIQPVYTAYRMTHKANDGQLARKVEKVSLQRKEKAEA